MTMHRVSSGDPLRIAASDWNELARTHDYVEELRNRTGPGTKGRQQIDTGKNYAWNGTGVAKPAGSIVGLADLKIDLAYGVWPVWEIGAPSEEGAKVGILIEPLPATGDSLAEVCVAGVARTFVNVSDTDHRFAVATGSYDTLDSAASGPFRILWADGEGDAKSAVVRLEANSGGDTQFDSITKVVTNVCPPGSTDQPTDQIFQGTEAIVTDSLTQVLSGEYVATTLTQVEAIALIELQDVAYQAFAGDQFEWNLYLGGESLNGTPPACTVSFGNQTQQFTYTFNFTVEAGTHSITMVAQRVAGTGTITATTGTRVTIKGKPQSNGFKVEFRQLLGNFRLGPPVCVIDPTGCCEDDDGSGGDTASLPNTDERVYSPGLGLATCVDLMAWPGFDAAGGFWMGQSSQSVPASMNVILPTFGPDSFPFATLGLPWPTVPECKSPWTDLLSGLNIRVTLANSGQSGASGAPEFGTQATYTTCGYGGTTGELTSLGSPTNLYTIVSEDGTTTINFYVAVNVSMVIDQDGSMPFPRWLLMTGSIFIQEVVRNGIVLNGYPYHTNWAYGARQFCAMESARTQYLFDGSMSFSTIARNQTGGTDTPKFAVPYIEDDYDGNHLGIGGIIATGAGTLEL